MLILQVTPKVTQLPQVTIHNLHNLQGYRAGIVLRVLTFTPSAGVTSMRIQEAPAGLCGYPDCCFLPMGQNAQPIPF